MRDLSHNTFPAKASKVTTLRINLALLSVILVVGLVYIFSINAIATSGYQIKKMSSQLSELETQHRKLELETSTLQSVSNIQQKTAQLNFVPATNITYIKDDNYALK